MPLFEGTQASIGIMWICAFGSIVTIVMRSPLVFLFAFVFLCTFFGQLKSLGGDDDDDVGESASNDFKNSDPNNDIGIMMKPLDPRRISGDMTLGEILSKY